MKIVSRILFLLFLLMAVLIAVSNGQPVELTLWPLPHQMVMPLYLLVVGLLLLGILAGLGVGWWAGRHHRRLARERARDVTRLEREVSRLRDVIALSQPAPSGAPASREQRAIERQSALVSPDLASPARGPFS